MENSTAQQSSFFDRPGVKLSQVKVNGEDVPVGMETVANPVGCGVYGAWGAVMITRRCRA
jgi:hypothetical protein